jgi:hypothetical protein
MEEAASLRTTYFYRIDSGRCECDLEEALLHGHEPDRRADQRRTQPDPDRPSQLGVGDRQCG